MKNIIIVEDSYDIKQIDFKQNVHDQNEIFTLNFDSHIILEEMNIQHKIGESLLSMEDRTKVFDTAISLRKWYEKHPHLKELEFKGVNIIEIFDLNEMHQLLLGRLTKLLILKRIIEKNKPQKIFASEILKQFIESIPLSQDIIVDAFPKLMKNSVFFDKYHISYKIGPLPISFQLKRKHC